MVALSALLGASATAAPADDSKRELTELSLEELFNVEVTSASKKPERRSEAAAALSVISGEDIRRIGATNLPDALRLIPGMHVARIDAAKWAVSMRGFSNRFSNKLLVMMDGRTIYTPLFAGVFWDAQDTYLDDLDRIEVIRGPGGALWGANAVNGVINILSKSSKQTQGLDAFAGGGNEERAFGGVRYGGKIGDKGHYRVYAKYSGRDGGSEPPNAIDDFDDWWLAQGGFRSDWELSSRDTVTLQGDAYGGESSPWGISPRSADINGANLLGRWRREFSASADGALQIYYDGTSRQDPFFEDRRHTLDIDSQHRWRPWSWDEIVWGFGYRIWGDDFDGTRTVALSRDSRRVQTVSGFLQNEITTLHETLRLTLGARLEHNDFTGFEIQPSGRLGWTPIKDLTAWAAVSRAVRVPSRLENDLVLRGDSADGAPSFELRGSPSTEAEELLAFQVGVRWKPTRHAFLDLTGFYDRYDDLIAFETQAPVFDPDPPPEQLVVPVVADNSIDGRMHGAEVGLAIDPIDGWRLRGSYSYLSVSIDSGAGTLDPQQTEGSSPANKVGVWSHFDLPWKLQADAVYRFVDSLITQRIGSYSELDLHLSRELWGGVELSVVGRDLLHDEHREFAGGTKVQRSVYGRVRWAF